METSLMSLTSRNQRLLAEILGLLSKIHPWYHPSSTELRKSSKTSWHRKVLVKPWNTDVWHLWVSSKSRQNGVEICASQHTCEVWLELWLWHLS